MKTRSLLRTVLLPGAMVLLAPGICHGLGASGSLVAGDASPTSRSLTAGSGFATSTETSPTLRVASSTTVSLHGITVRLAPEGRVVVATCHYDGGTPVAGANLTLFAPGVDAPYLTGTTDPAGFYAFLPSSSGEWRIVVDDGMGHRREARIAVVAAPGAAAGAELGGHVDHGHDTDHAHDTDHGHDTDHAHDTQHAASAELAGAVADPTGTLDHEHPEGSSVVATSVDHAHSHEAEGSDRPWKLATGLSLIVGLTGFSYGFSARRTRA